jgi:site-specific DNA-adenine methylase
MWKDLELPLINLYNALRKATHDTTRRIISTREALCRKIFNNSQTTGQD